MRKLGNLILLLLNIYQLYQWHIAIIFGRILNYQQIFASRVEELLSSYLIYVYCLSRSKDLEDSLVSLDKIILKYSNFHLARVIGSLQLGEDWHRSPSQQLDDFIKKLEQDPLILSDDYERAKTIIKQVVEEISEGDTTKIINVLKSDKIQQRLNTLMSKTS